MVVHMAASASSRDYHGRAAMGQVSFAGICEKNPWLVT
jgi:hypothetical protein